ncbi:autoinducer 2 ABC transporter substrate-binding protein [Paenibacillus thailandensis]|uniref:Autoinducer 2 ABC transporter substrate-binding protein n=1 Tax=Paenibacillus thailandensis TaxID=393250 RepID=A0ABW5R492_9BACL
MRWKWLIVLPLCCLLTSCAAFGGGPTYEIVYELKGETAGSTPTSGSAEPGGDRYTIALVPKSTDNPYFKVANDGAQEAGDDLGVEVLYQGPRTADAAGQAKTIEALADAGVDLIAVSANDPDLLAPALRRAREKGIKVVTWDSDASANARDFFINMADPETLGRHLMDTLASHTGQSGEFAVLTGALSAANLNEWIKWIRVQREQYYPGMKLAEVAPTDDDPQKAYAAAKQLLEEHPNLAGIIGNSSIATPAAAQAVQEAGKAGEIKVVGLSTPVLIGPYLRDGSAQMATLWSPKRLGYLTVALAKQYLDGTLPENGQYVRNVGSIRVNGDTVIMGEPLDFTKENVGQYDF